MACARFYALKTPEAGSEATLSQLPVATAAYPIKTTKWGNFTYCEGGFPLSRAVQVVTAQGSTPECIGVNVGSWCWRQQHRITLEFRAGLSRPHVISSSHISTRLRMPIHRVKRCILRGL
ncbi:hypothetical protein PC118_g22652 [Phytophthora cactorum]|uniref:Uncharacterized protein n=1 Tax=Phytophthora cactorum TaxID=29920 RepID=A0A8T1AQX6_9STRA|nr:hypothetical protein PC117_g25042 [Phytophthora cactorum]KAG2960179.1 hypothetical protein PC118_g22652 [Phytophthora cactorum]